MRTVDGPSDNKADISIDGSPEADPSHMDVSYDESDHDGNNDDDEEEEDRDMVADNDGDEAQNKQPRLMRACDNCRRKKVKCNGTKPSCTHCTRMKLACHYSPLVRKKRTRRSLIDKLEERLESMEQMLQPLVERLTPNDPIMGAADGRHDLRLNLASAHAAGIAHSLGFPLPTASPFLGGAPQQQQQQYPGYIPQFGAGNIPREISYMPTVPSGDISPGPPLPPQHIIEELVELALVRLAPAQPPISLPTVLRRLRNGQLPEYIICGCIALAARFSSRPEFSCTPRYNAGREYAKRAAELVSGLIDKPDPDVVFCMVMLSLYEWGCGLGESAWSYTGMATRLAQRLRLHLVDETEFTENEDDRDTSWASTEWKRRMWWCVYISDRTSLIVASRPATVHDDDYVVNLPSHDHEWINGAVPSDDESADLATQVSQGTAEPHNNGASAPSAQQQSRDQKNCHLLKKKAPDSMWLVVELYRTCSRISEFSNRRRRAVRPNDISRRTMFDILDRELEDLRSRFMPCMEFPPRTEWLLSGYANLGNGINGMLSVYTTCFNIHLMYYAAKIILYRSELPEYEHETIGPDLIARAKAVCVDAAHKQAEIIRWAFDNLPVENWDPKIGVWSLQGASIHVNAALSDDNVVAEQSRKDLEVHLKLHVESDKYYHFNMAIITMLHRVFNLRKQQRLAMSSDYASSGDPTEYSAGGNGNTAVVAAPTKCTVDVFIKHKTDQDPWIVPRCSSFLGFTYNSSQLRGILNKAIKQTTYGPPDSPNADGSTKNQRDSTTGLASRPVVSTSLLNEHTQAATSPSISAHYPPLVSPMTAPSAIDRRLSTDANAPAASYGLDVSGGLWYGPQTNGLLSAGANVNAMAQSLPTGLQNLDLHMHHQHSGLNAMAQQQMGYSTMGGIGSLSSAGVLSNAAPESMAVPISSGGDTEPSRSIKRSFSNAASTADSASRSIGSQGTSSIAYSNGEAINPGSTKTNGKKPATKTKGTGNRGCKSVPMAVSSNSQPSQKPEGAQKIKQLQRLEELRARVTLIQQLSNNSGGDPTSMAREAMTATKSSSATNNSLSNLSAPQSSDVNGFLNTFAASIGSMANQLGSDSGGGVAFSTGGANNAAPSAWLGSSGMTDTATAAMTGVASGSANQYGLQNLSNQEIQIMLAQLAPMSTGTGPSMGTDHTQQQQQQQQPVSPSELANSNDSAPSVNPMLLGINPDMGYSNADVQRMIQKLSATLGSSGSDNSAQ
ncbi:hypothetical protein LPJ74_003310 [Coemansia sp. RSA 1843]|nr:hypothetical protein LPJ74_003310 [Coemansia sp. RSA 1843]